MNGKIKNSQTDFPSIYAPADFSALFKQERNCFFADYSRGPKHFHEMDL